MFYTKSYLSSPFDSEMKNILTKYHLIILLLCILHGNASSQTSASQDTTARYVAIDNVFILGNKKTKKSIILRELVVKKGMLIYYPDLIKHIEADQNKLFNLRLFNSVKINILELSPSKVDIVVQVDERWYTFPIPILKFADRNFNDWLKNQGADFSRINYGIKFTQYNVRGRNEKLRLTAQFGFTKNFAMSYRAPYIDKSQNNGLELKVGYRERKNTAYGTVDHKQIFYDSENTAFEETYGLIKYTRRSKFYDFHDFILEYNRSSVSDSILIFNPSYFSNRLNKQSYVALRYKYTKDKRDVVAYPLKGYRIQGEVNKIGLGISNDLNILELRVTHDRYLDLGKNYYFSMYTKGVLSTPENQSYTLFPSLGRQQDFVRGYELYLIEGSSFGLNKISFKKLLFKGEKHVRPLVRQFKNFPYALYLKTYIDIGYVKNFNQYEQNNRLTNRLIRGTGLGLDFVTFYDFVIRTEYSINDDKEQGFFFHFKKGF